MRRNSKWLKMKWKQWYLYNYQKLLRNNENIVNYFDGQVFKTSNGHTAILLLEFCQGGSLFDLMMKYEKTKLNEK